jgi:hypothetical protein
MHDLAEQLASLHPRPGPAAEPRAPASAVRQSPILEYLVEEVAAGLPDTLATRLRAAPDISHARDWIAAGALYRQAVATDRTLAERFLVELGDEPARAGLALARALAARIAPAPQTTEALRQDRLGLVLQLAFAAAILGLRVGVFEVLAQWIGTHESARVAIRAIPLYNVPGLGLNPRGTPDWAAALALALGVVWLGFEVILAPSLMERLRQLPARLANGPPVLSRRTDQFYILWYTHSMSLLIAAASVLLYALALWSRTHGLAGAASGELAAMAILATGVLAAAFGIFPSLLRLGTERLWRH